MFSNIPVKQAIQVIPPIVYTNPILPSSGLQLSKPFMANCVLTGKSFCG